MSDVTLYNTRSRRKERLTPVAPGRASMYVCGPTVYDRAHIGNARAVVVFDTLFRLLRHEFGPGNVAYVRNFTDVDDKINRRATETGRAIRDITDETIGWFRADMKALGALPPTAEPRATKYIPQMIAMIGTLISRGHAYEAEGHVLFAVGGYPDYGALSRRSVEDMRAGARVEVAPYKRDPMDFVLWKPSDPATPGWDSPWGRGRPGWHIECSAMARELLGPAFDIHGGGADLMFPHHENELAQSRCAHPEGEFARIWMHNGMLNVEREKMSKSLGNFFTVRELLDRGIPGPVIRFVLLSTHYRQRLDWTDRKIREATTNLMVWEKLVRDARRSGLPVDEPSVPAPAVLAALTDDLNTSAAITAMRELATRIRLGGSDADEAASRFLPSLSLMGLELEGLREPAIERAIVRAFEKTGISSQDDLNEKVEALLAERRKAREGKDYVRADMIRNNLAAAGIIVWDNPDGDMEWEVTAKFDPVKFAGIDA